MTRISVAARLRRGDDAGLALLEVVVALVVLALFASAVAVMLGTAFKTSRTNRLRVQASDLASRQIEIARNTDVLSVPDGQVYGTATGGVSASPVTVPLDGVPFTVTQEAEYVPANSATSTCAAPAGSRLAYKRVSVVVTWPSMGGSKPPRVDTLMQLPVTGLDNTKGVLSVPVKNAAGQPVSGARITVTEAAATVGSATTGSDGCAVIDGLTPASDYSVTESLNGDVDTNGNPAPTHTAPAVTAATLSRDSGFVVDSGGAITLTLVPPSGSYALPATPFDVTVTNTSAAPPYSKTFPDCSIGPAGYCSTGSGLTRTVGSPNDSSANQHGLFPFTTQDAVYVNDFGDAKAPSVSVSVPGGGTATTTNPVGGIPLGGIALTNHASAASVMWAYDSALATDQTIQLSPNTTPVGLNATASFALPYGSWCIAATKANAQACVSGQTVSLSSGAKTASVSVSS